MCLQVGITIKRLFFDISVVSMSYGPFFRVDFYYRCMFTYASKFWVANQSFTYNSICNTANDQVMKATKFVLSFAKEIN